MFHTCIHDFFVFFLTRAFIFVSISDHMVRLIDIRKFNEPYLVMKGHKKAVSYVQYLNDKELVSASVHPI